MDAFVASTAVPIYQRPRSNSSTANRILVKISTRKNTPKPVVRTGSASSGGTSSSSEHDASQDPYMQCRGRKAVKQRSLKVRSPSQGAVESPRANSPPPPIPSLPLRSQYPEEVHSSSLSRMVSRQRSPEHEQTKIAEVYELEGSTPTSSGRDSEDGVRAAGIVRAALNSVPETQPPGTVNKLARHESRAQGKLSPPRVVITPPADSENHRLGDIRADRLRRSDEPPVKLSLSARRQAPHPGGEHLATPQEWTFDRLYLDPTTPEAGPKTNGQLSGQSKLSPTPYYPLRRSQNNDMAPSQPSNYTSGSNAAALNPAATFQHIQDMAAKRISTLDYLRKAHEGRVYWFNTLLFSQSDILRLPSYQSPRLARRASNLLLLGLSIPQALDPSAHSAVEYVRALNALLAEFEAYQQVHPPEGGSNSLGSGSFSRAKLPKMFSRSQSSKTRRASTATDIGLPMPPGFEAQSDGALGAGPDSMASSTTTLGGGAGSNPSASASGTTLATATPSGPSSHTTALPAPDAATMLPGEEYSYLLTPSLPFEPDFFEVFATLADVLIDVYMRITALVSSPEKVALQPGLAEVFAKADARIRKVLVLGIVKEFEEATRTGVKGEMAGVGRVVFGGLM